jgi:hypothetical protein
VLWVDRFGNCQLNVGPDEVAGVAAGAGVLSVSVDQDRRAARLASTFAELPAGAIGLVLDSQGMYALALDQRSAAAELRLAQGDAVRLSRADADADATTSPVELKRSR